MINQADEVAQRQAEKERNEIRRQIERAREQATLSVDQARIQELNIRTFQDYLDRSGFSRQETEASICLLYTSPSPRD